MTGTRRGHPPRVRSLTKRPLRPPLIDAGAKVSQRCASGRTALTYAHEHKVAPETMRVLLDAGARIEEKDLGADDDGAVLEQMFADLEEIAFSDMDDE